MASRYIVLSFPFPSKKSDDYSHRTKRSRVSELKQSHQTPELATAAFTRGYDRPGNQELSETIKHDFMNPLNSYTPKLPVKMSTDTALALKVQCGLSDSQYQLLRNAALQHNSDIFPTLKNINQEKSKALR